MQVMVVKYEIYILAELCHVGTDKHHPSSLVAIIIWNYRRIAANHT
jgi:hypothetical protein